MKQQHFLGLGLLSLALACQPAEPPAGDCTTGDVICGEGTVCNAATGFCEANQQGGACDNVVCNDARENCNESTGQCEAPANFLCGTGAGVLLPTGVNLGVSSSVDLDLTLNGGFGGGSCAATSAQGSDNVIQLTVPETSDLLIKTVGSADTVLYLRAASCNDGQELACNDVQNVALSPEAAVLDLRDVPAGEYFLFVDSKLADPLSVQLQIRRTQVVAQGESCSLGLSSQRCATGLTCIFPNDGGEIAVCEDFAIPGTRLFVLDSSGNISELNPANGTVVNSFPAPFQVSGTEHYALAYDSLQHRLFLHDSANPNVDPNNGNADINNEVFVVDADTGAVQTVWGTANLGIQIEGLAYNIAADKLAAYDASQDLVTVVQPNNGQFSFDYGLVNNDPQIFGGLGIDAIGTVNNNGTLGGAPEAKGYVTKSFINQVQQFVLNVGNFIRSIGAPSANNAQCGLGAHGDFVFIGYTDGLIRVVSAADGSFVTEYFAPGVHACGVDAGGL